MDSSSTRCHSETTPNTTSPTSSKSHSSSKLNQNNHECTFLIVGGGIAGVSCAESINFLAPEEKTIILSESPLIKSVTNLVQLGKYIQRFEVKEIEANELSKGNVTVITDQLKLIQSKIKVAQTVTGINIKYKFLCICTGARPKLIDSVVGDMVMGIRDTESVKEFQSRLINGKKFVLVGNGGIASEIAYEIKNIEIDWIIKDDHISSTFVDPAAAKFFELRLFKKDQPEVEQTSIKRMRYTEASQSQSHGAALGPDWHRLIDISSSSAHCPDNLRIHYNAEIKSISRNQQESLTVELMSGAKIVSDFIVSATGVEPFVNFDCDEEIKLSRESGIFVDELMRTSIDSVFAAGDICCCHWEHSKFWHQMKLWTQARQMGMMAGKSMVAHHKNEEIYQDFCFELFSHVTKLYGYQVVLLGKFNGQGLGDDYELLFRITPDKEYIKFVLKEGRLVGALLIGETHLEETCENLILNEIDLTPFGDDILNPNIDIEDYFD